jgi:hypothetical protein
MNEMSRRQVLGGLAVIGLTSADLGRALHAQAASTAPELAWPQPVTGIGPAYPTSDAFLVKELVGASHNNLDRVKAIVSRQPALADASWDWGFGDWESPLGAASHVGNRPIAEFLLDHGATPTIFSSAMLGHLDAVKAMLAARPGLERIRGPHSLTLLSHARAGGQAAAPVLAYLETVSGSNTLVPTQALTEQERALVPGRYVFGTGARDVLVIDEVREVLGITRAGATRRNLVHLGNLTFAPVGAEAVRINVVRAGDRVDGLTVADPDVVLRATRERG